MQSIVIAARMMGWRRRLIDELTADQFDQRLARDCSAGPEAEHEHAEALLAIGSVPIQTTG